jgi:hypothetical protein
MTTPNKMVSTHVVGKGVKFDCSEWIDESIEGWSRGKFVSTNVSGKGTPLQCEELGIIRLVFTVKIPTSMAGTSVRSTLDDLLSDLNIMSENLGHERFELEAEQTGEREPGVYTYSLNTYGSDLTPKLAKIVAALLTKKAAQNSVRVVVSSANETICDIAA